MLLIMVCLGKKGITEVDWVIQAACRDVHPEGYR